MKSIDHLISSLLILMSYRFKGPSDALALTDLGYLIYVTLET